ncbi:MAG: Gamma-glutamyltranspeptidase, partial [Frankiales bacterium]|nr:Gamma-glutamyltranspeptidase [Frankiales bacterium]
MSPSRRRLAVLLAPLAGLALVAVPLPGAAAAGSVTLTPEPQGDLATRQGRSVTVDGQVPAGALGARLVAVTTAGDEVVQEYTSGTIGQPDGAQYLRNDAGHLVGRLPIGCPFGPEDLCGPHAPVTGVRLDVTVDGAPFPSGVLPVDYDRPEITRYLLVAPDRIQVRFDEPVRGDDSALDWTVQDPDAVVSQVEAPAGDCTSLPDGDYRRSRSGCTRVLVLARPLSEDATPLVTYAPALNRPLYDDDASNRVNRDSETTATTSRALDAVPPAVPSIDAIDGRAPAGTPPTVAGRATAPAVVVGGLTPGHRVEVSAKRDAAASSDVLVVATAAGSTQEVTLKDLASAGQVASYDVRAVAVDPSGNRSAGDGVRNPARYQLDAQPPMLLGADSRDGSSITVTFSEPVLPDGGAPADWEVKDPAGTAIPVTGVSGTGAERRLTPTAPAGSTVTYMGTRYADAVGNPLPTTSVPLAAVAVPLVRKPTTTTYVTTSSVGVTGTSGAGRHEVYRDKNADGVPDGA